MPTFQPPTIDDVPPVTGERHPWPTGPAEYRLFSHYKNRARGRTLILKTDGTVAGPFDWPTQLVYNENTPASSFVTQGLAEIPNSAIARVFTGGHIHYVSAAEAALLTAAGYGSGISGVGFGGGGYGEGFYGG